MKEGWDLILPLIWQFNTFFGELGDVESKVTVVRRSP